MQRVVERILNLLAFLLSVGRPVSADEIRFTVAGYGQESDEAFLRSFARDKDLLRRLGVPLRLVPTDVWEVEQGYVVRSEDYALPDPGLTDEERAALWLAAQVVRVGGQAPDPAVLFKLGGAPPPFAGGALGADIGGAADTLADLFTAVTEARLVGFTYRDKERRVRPYGLVHRRGHWYLVGLQSGEDEPRSYRVDRLGGLRVGKKAGAFTRPKGWRAADAVPASPWEAGEAGMTVTVRFDPQVAWWARRQLTSGAEIAEEPDGGLVARIPVASVPAFLGWLVGFEDAAEILDPQEVRAALLAHVGAAP